MPVPTLFHSFETKAPFTNCIMCEKYLLEAGTEYFVEKAIRQYHDFGTSDVIFEYAICMDCAEEMRHTFSRDSMQKVEAYFSQHADMANRMYEMMNKGEMTAEAWTSHCLIKGTPKEELHEYQLCAHFNGDHLLFHLMPYMISDKAADEMSNLLSNQTLGEIDDFIDQHFGLPPDFKKALKDKEWFLV